MRLRSLFFAMLVTAIPAAAQPVQITCNGATCTFTLNFDDGYAHLANIAGAPYSGQIQYGNSRTLPNGTHMSNQSSGPLIYRDSKGRVRTERHAYSTANGRPTPPDDFVIAEIHDPVAGFEYVLDPVNQVAHRRPFNPESSWKWDPSQITNMQAQPYGGPAGPTSMVQFLGTQTISGVLAYGQKTAWTRTTPGGEVITQTEEEWLDPASGALLSSVSGATGSANTTTMTIANYSNAGPAPGLFQVPQAYQTVDETGSFQVVHPHLGPGSGSTGVHAPQLTGSCEEGVCTVTFDPGNAPVNPAVTGAPYAGHQIFSSVSGNGTPYSASPNGTGQYRDSYGRLRTDPAQVSVRAQGRGNTMPPLVEIEDPVAGYFSILDPASQTAYRIKAAFRSFAFQPPMARPAGTQTGPNGQTDTVENLGSQIISGVTATGQRNTSTYPPGTYSQNDKAIVTLNERWIDPKTGVAILTKNSGVGFTTTMSIPDYQEGDPGPSLFQIPAGYKIVDEAGPFTFTAAPAP